MDVNEHESQSNTTLGHKLKQMNITYIAVLHFSHSTVFNKTLKWVWNGTEPEVEWY
jgi:hypothetical protein